jgi:hypothetical protein
MLDLILLGLIGLIVYVCVKGSKHQVKIEDADSIGTEKHVCIYCIARRAIDKVKRWLD